MSVEPEVLSNDAVSTYYESVLVCPGGVHSLTDVQLHLQVRHCIIVVVGTE